MEQSSAIRLENVTKTFGPVVANKDICLDIRYGELIYENIVKSCIRIVFTANNRSLPIRADAAVKKV